MTYITPGELHTMRATTQQTLAGTAVISRPAYVPDGQGGGTQTFAAAGTVACNIAPYKSRAGDERVIADRLQTALGFYLTVPALTDIAMADRVVCGGGTFEVVALREPRTVEIVRRAVIAQIL